MLRRRGLFTAVGEVMLLVTMLGAPSPANAAWWRKLWPTAWWSRSTVPAVSTTHPTPEIDPGMVRSGLVLLGGGLAVLTDRRRRRGSSLPAAQTADRA
jgi:hypothetical protein